MRYPIDFNSPFTIDEEGIRLIETAKKAIALPQDYENRDIIIDEAMNELYTYFSKYDEKKLHNYNVQIELFNVECLLRKEYLPINTVPLYNEKQETKLEDSDDVLKYIVNCTRSELAKYHDLKTDSLEKECPCTSSTLEEICDKLGIENIHVGVSQSLRHGMFHHFTIVRINGENGESKNYLADCTYRQFFTKNNSNPRRISVIRGPAEGCSIGSYMMMTDRRKEIAETILSQGYIELTPEVFKEYLDAIIYSGRSKDFYDENGLDYMNPNDVSPTYSVNDYLQVLYKNRIINDQVYLALRNDLVDNPLEKDGHKRK